MTLPTPRLHGIRGATTVDRNDANEILAATDELLRTLIETNDLQPDDIVSALFTVTRDLDAAFPARAAEEFGWNIVALLHASEIPVPGFASPLHPAAGPRLHPPRPRRNQALLSPGGHGLSVPTGRDRRAGDGARRRALGAGPSLDLSQRRASSTPTSRDWCRSQDPARPLHRPGAAVSRLRDPAAAAGADRRARWMPRGGASGSRRPRRARDRHRRDRLPAGARRRRRPPFPGGGSLRPLARGADPLRRPGDDAASRSSTRLLASCSSPRASCSATTSPPAGASGSRPRSRSRLGSVPREIEVREGGVRYLAAPWEGQKTGAFLDQRPNRLLAGEADPARRARARLLRLSRLLRLAPRRPRRRSCWPSTRARTRWSGRAPTRRSTASSNIEWREADVFEVLRGDGAGARAVRHRSSWIRRPSPRSRATVPDAIRGYREINLRAMRCLAPGGTLLTASCSFHVRLPGVPHHARGGGRATAAAASACAASWARARTIRRS